MEDGGQVVLLKVGVLVAVGVKAVVVHDVHPIVAAKGGGGRGRGRALVVKASVSQDGFAVVCDDNGVLSFALLVKVVEKQVIVIDHGSLVS